MSVTSLRWMVPALYVASGAAALMLEVAWTRLLTLEVGHTTGATSTVLAAFMGGLAAGSAIGGRVAERVDRRGALRWYAGLELLIALSALALPLLLAAATPLLEAAYADGQAPLRFAIARVAASLLALAVPTLAMGATFPLATRALAADRRHAELPAGLLYTANTIGAAAGAVAAGFVLLPALGIRWTTAIAALLNTSAAIIAWRAARALPADPPSSQPTRPTKGRAAADRISNSPSLSSSRFAWLGVVAAAMSGLVALISQVVWTRVLALIVGPTTFAFSAMVGVFIAGLAIGAAIGTRLARGRAAAIWLGVAALTVAAATAMAMHLTGRLLLWIAMAAAPTTAFELVVFRQIGVAAALLGPLSLAFGAAFPLSLAVAAGGAGLTPARLSWTYAANAGGAIAGALVAGFLLIPALGLQTTLRIGAIASILVGTIVLLAFSGSWRSRSAAIAAAALVLAGVLRHAVWDPALLSSGAYRFAPAAPPGELEAVLTAGDLLFYEEGAGGAVAVRRLAGTTSLIIDGKPDASNAGDMLTQKLLAHLPLLLHAAPRTASVLGLGSGVTAGAALTHPIARLDVVEISPAVVRASAFFKAENRDALADPRTRLLVTDGRSHLRLGNARYDVVISEPSNPWMAGVASLFTREFMSSVRDRLAPGGIFCQWTHTYDMSDADLRSIAATFVDVFPHASLWLVGESDVLLIGSSSSLRIDPAALASRYARPGVADDLRTVAVSRLEDLLGLHLAGTRALRAYAAGAPPQTDDRMALEFSAPRSLAARTGRDNVQALLGLSRSLAPSAPPTAATADQWASRGRMLLRAEAYDLAFTALTNAVALQPDDEASLDALSRAAGGAGRIDEAITQLRGLIDDGDTVARSGITARRSPALADSTNDAGRAPRQGDDGVGDSTRSRRVPARVALARLLMARGDVVGAVGAVLPAASAAAARSADRPQPGGLASRTPTSAPDAPPRIAQGDTRAARQLASIFADLGDADRLAPVVAALQRQAPDAPDTQYFAASLAFLQGQLDTAVRLAQRLVASHPTDARAYNLIGAALATQGHPAEARAAFARSMAADPRDAATYVNAASLEIEQGRPHDAARLFAIALTLDEQSDAARRGLASARAALGSS